MAQLFHPAMNVIFPTAIVVGTAALLGSVLLGWGVEMSPYITLEKHVQPQPVPFSHEHHVRGLGIDCRYCHTSVEDSEFAGIPPTKTCMTCHSQIWTNAALLQPVRDSWLENKPIAWKRVHNLPNFVFFNHSIHVNKGIGCVSCHGQVDEMPLMWKNASLQMRWCLDCHRNTVKNLRPRDEVFNLHYDARQDPRFSGKTQDAIGHELGDLYHVLPRQQLENCSTCHR